MKFNYGLSALLTSAAVVFFPLQLALSLTQTQVDKIAREITVRIDGDGSGSGWIYEHKGDIYYVVTNHHVVAKDNGKYQIRTADGESHDAVERPSVKSNLDLAVLQFVSKKQYTIANIGNSDQIKANMTVYAVGWAESLGNNINILQEKKTAYSASQTEFASNTSKRGYEFQPGNILNLLQNPIGEGYGLMYDNQVDPGMSGGPLLDENGRVIGINGLGIEWQTGYVRLGIPINTFLAARSSLQPLAPSSPAITQQPNYRRTTTRQQSAESLISLGGAKADKGDYQGAIAYYNQAIKISPNNADAYYKRAFAHYHLNDNKASIDDFNRVVKLIPKSYRAYFYRGAIYGIQKDYERAIEDFNITISLNPIGSDAYLLRGLAYKLQGKTKEALVDYKQATRVNPKSSKVWIAQGRVLADLGENEEALVSYNQAIQLNNDWGTSSLADAYLGRGRVYYKQGNKKAALQDLNQPTRINPESSLAWYKQGGVLLELGLNQEAIASYDRAIQLNNDWGTSSLADAYLVRGVVRSKQGNQQAALQDFTEATRINPKYSLAWENQGRALRDLGRNSEAIAAYDRAIQINNNWGNSSLADAYLGRGVVLVKQGNKQAALQDFAQATRTNPKSSLAWYVQGAWLAELGRNSEAVTAYDHAIQVNNDWGNSSLADAYLGRGRVYYKQGNKKAALQDLNQPSRINPKSSLAWDKQGGVLADLGLYQEAITAYDRAIELNSDWGTSSLADAYSYRGSVHEHQGNEQAALQDYSQAIRINPKSSLVWYNRAYTLVALGRNSEAITSLDSAIQLNNGWNSNKLADAHVYRGLIKYELQDVEEAIRQFRVAITINNQSAEPQLAQAVALYTKGDQERGLAMAEAALKLDNKFANVEFLKKNHWGVHMIADTQKLLQNPRIQAILSHGK